MNNDPNTSFTLPPTVNTSPKGPRKKIVFGILGVLILLSSIGAGAYLVQQNQNIRSKAAEPIGVEPGCLYEYTDAGKGYNGTPGGFKLSGTCNGNVVYYRGPSCPTTERQTQSVTAVTGTTYHVVNNQAVTDCFQADYQPSANPSQGIGVCKCGDSVPGGNGEPGGTPQPPVCGDQCTSDSQCEQSNPNSMCSDAGVCVSKTCPGSTTPGANCSCFESNVQQCGEPCGFLAGSCGDGSSCGFINVPTNQCANYETKADGQQSPYQYCIPDQPTNGYSLAPNCSDIFTIRLAKPDGSVTGLTAQDVVTACSPNGTPAPPLCGELLERPHPDFVVVDTSAQSFLTDPFRSPAISGKRAIGFKIVADDQTPEFGASDFSFRPTIVYTNASGDVSTNSFTSAPCYKGADGFYDMCGLRSEYDYYVPRYARPHPPEIKSVRFNIRRDSGDGSAQIQRLRWIYADICASPSATPDSTTARCLSVEVYDTNWNVLTSTQLSNLKAGDTVRLGVLGDSSAGQVDRARFSINGTLQPVTTTRRTTGAATEFYIDYPIPAGQTRFVVNAQVHHDSLGWF